MSFFESTFIFQMMGGGCPDGAYRSRTRISLYTVHITECVYIYIYVRVHIVLNRAMIFL